MRDELTKDSTQEERSIYKAEVAAEAEAEGRNRGFDKMRVAIEGMVAEAFFNPKGMVLMDPDDPTVDIEALYQARGRQMRDLKMMNINCPLCKKTMAYELFINHTLPCMKKWYKLTDPTLRTFAGPQRSDLIIPAVQSTSIIGVPASADADAPVEETP